jgi:hypothetical protein
MYKTRIGEETPAVRVLMSSVAPRHLENCKFQLNAAFFEKSHIRKS